MSVSSSSALCTSSYVLLSWSWRCMAAYYLTRVVMNAYEYTSSFPMFGYSCIWNEIKIVNCIYPISHFLKSDVLPHIAIATWICDWERLCGQMFVIFVVLWRAIFHGQIIGALNAHICMPWVICQIKPTDYIMISNLRAPNWVNTILLLNTMNS